QSIAIVHPLVRIWAPSWTPPCGIALTSVVSFLTTVTHSTRLAFSYHVHFLKLLLVHPNPDNRILHTALVGEMNGFLHALTVGNPDADKVIPLATPRAYTKWIAPPADSRPIPPRPPDAETGSAFIDRVAHLTAKER